MDLARASNLPPPETAADRFNRGIKRDPSQLKTSQNELYWDDCYRGFPATATAQGLANVLNESYVPSTATDLKLFLSQHVYMYSVLIDRLQTDKLSPNNTDLPIGIPISRSVFRKSIIAIRDATYSDP
jgi:hypothetical protein